MRGIVDRPSMYLTYVLNVIAYHFFIPSNCLRLSLSFFLSLFLSLSLSLSLYLSLSYSLCLSLLPCHFLSLSLSLSFSLSLFPFPSSTPPSTQEMTVEGHSHSHSSHSHSRTYSIDAFHSKKLFSILITLMIFTKPFTLMSLSIFFYDANRNRFSTIY